MNQKRKKMLNSNELKKKEKFRKRFNYFLGDLIDDLDLL